MRMHSLVMRDKTRTITILLKLSSRDPSKLHPSLSLLFLFKSITKTKKQKQKNKTNKLLSNFYLPVDHMTIRSNYHYYHLS